jgi:hypothetical protein
VRGSVSATDLHDLVGDAIAVCVGQRHDAVGAALRDEQRAVGCDGHEPRPVQAPGTDRRLVPVRNLELCTAARPRVEVHAHERRQLCAQGRADAEEHGECPDAEQGEVAEAPHQRMLGDRSRSDEPALSDPG